MQVNFLTPDYVVYEGESIGVNVPGEKGSFEILNNHAAIISSITKGEVRIKTDQKNILKYTVSEGIVEVKDNKIVILTEEAKQV